jgi:type I restriction enzyme M protein
MANSGSDARGSELEIRRRLIEDGSVDAVIAVGSNFFYSVTLPVTLWFFDKGKRGTDRAKTVLFIDARHIYRQIDRAHREFTPGQIEFLANIVRMYRGEDIELLEGSDELIAEHFPEKSYRNAPGLCAVAGVEEIEAQAWSLNPGRYVGMAEGKGDGIEFEDRLGELNDELEALKAEARELEDKIASNVRAILSGKGE